MSWDAVLVRTKGKPGPAWEAEEVPLGKRADVLAAIMAVFPSATRDTRTQLFYRDGDLSIEFHFQGKNPVDSILLEVRGEGDPITPLLDLAARNGWALLDCSTSEFIDPKNPSDNGYGGYRKLVKGISCRKPPRRRKR
jgi:hypothetical protein